MANVGCTRQFLGSLNIFVVVVISFAALVVGLSAQQQPVSTSPAATQPGPSLLFQTNLDCTFALDDGASQMLKAGDVKKQSIGLGEHLVMAVSLDRKDEWRTVINADKPLQKVVLIDLQKIRTDRVNAERQAGQLEQEIKAKKEQAEKLKTATQQLTEQQDVVKRRRAEIQDQIAELQKQQRQELTDAQNAESQAQQFSRGNAATVTGQQTTLGTLATAANNALAATAANSAQAHRAKAGQLQDQIIDFNRQLEGLNSGVTVTSSTGATPRVVPSGANQASPNSKQDREALWSTVRLMINSKDGVGAVRLLREGAAAGNNEAVYFIGWLYQNGWGVPRDYGEAVKWYRRAADAGNGYAMYQIGWLYLRGLGVEKDRAAAVQWNRKGADAGNINAMLQLGWMYENGKYENGKGGTKNREEAISWYRKAAAAGNEEAKNSLKRLRVAE